MRRAVLALVALMVTGAGAAVAIGQTQAHSAVLDEAIRTYDLTASTVLLAWVRDAMREQPTAEHAALHVRASLAVAEILRIEWEQTPSSESARRRELGSRIDATAEEGLGVVAQLPDSSERERMRADLLATMIRSDFRAKKYESQFLAAAGRSLELDEGNARAWVTAAKPFLFAAPEHGGDLAEALRLLNRALELDPGLESALLLRALANERLGEADAAETDLRAALDHNPDCLPARRALDRIAGS